MMKSMLIMVDNQADLFRKFCLWNVWFSLRNWSDSVILQAFSISRFSRIAVTSSKQIKFAGEFYKLQAAIINCYIRRKIVGLQEPFVRVKSTTSNLSSLNRLMLLQLVNYRARERWQNLKLHWGTWIKSNMKIFKIFHARNFPSF